MAVCIIQDTNTAHAVWIKNTAEESEELKHHNIRSFCISPSSTKSKMGEDTIGQDYSTFLDASDIAKYVAFAISFDSNIVTEEILLKRMTVK